MACAELLPIQFGTKVSVRLFTHGNKNGEYNERQMSGIIGRFETKREGECTFAVANRISEDEWEMAEIAMPSLRRDEMTEFELIMLKRLLQKFNWEESWNNRKTNEETQSLVEEICHDIAYMGEEIKYAIEDEDYDY